MEPVVGLIVIIIRTIADPASGAMLIAVLALTILLVAVCGVTKAIWNRGR